MPRIKYQEAIGLEVRRGRPTKGNKPSKKELLKLYVKESKPIREVAEKIGCTKDMIFRSLKEYAIETREPVKRTKLWNYDLETLEKCMKDKGTREFAREIGVSESTLRYHVKKARKWKGKNAQ
ncbi:MAG: hypothetical protein MUO70_01055 [Euryarchaeota archaeon]|nr:hypothetical protein [Euryarchaeota archaeon]